MVNHCLEQQQKIAPQKEKIVEIVPEELTERGTQPHAVYLDGESIGRIYYKKKRFLLCSTEDLLQKF